MVTQVISFGGESGGIGRTTTALALATVWLAAGQRVAVLDCSSDAKLCPPLRLSHWSDALHDIGVPSDRLVVRTAYIPETAEEAISRLRDEGFDKILIDLGREQEALALAAIVESDLIVAMLRDPMQAVRTSVRIEALGEISQPVVGLRMHQDPVHNRFSAVMVEGFKAGPVLVNEAIFVEEFWGLPDRPRYLNWLRIAAPHLVRPAKKTPYSTTQRVRRQWWEYNRIAAELESLLLQTQPPRFQMPLWDTRRYCEVMDNLRAQLIAEPA